MSPMTNGKSTSSPRPGSRSRNPAESDRASAPMVGLDELFHHGRILLAPAPTVENAVMAHAASHQIFLLALRQVDRVLERRLGLAKARNIIPLTLHGKQGDIGYRCEIDMAAAVPHPALRQQVPLENRVDRLEIELRRQIAHRSEERREGNECVSACRSRWWRLHKKTKK